MTREDSGGGVVGAPQDSLTESGDRFRGLVPAGPAVIARFDRQGRCLYVNRVITRYVDLTPQDCIGRTIPELGLSQEPVELWERAIHAVLETGEPQEFAFDFDGPRGQTVFDCRMAPEHDEEGRVRAVVSVARDVTARRLAEEALRQSEERHRALFETITEGIVYQDAEGQIVSANPAAEQILGLTLDQMQGRTSSDPEWRAIHEDGSDFPGHAHPAMAALTTGQTVQGVVMGVFNPRRDDWVWIKINAVPQFRPGEDRAYQVYTVFEEITERRRVQQALRDSEERYRRLVERSPDIAYIYSDRRGALYWSPRVEEVLGISPDELMERPYLWHDAIHPDDLPRVDEAISSWEIGKHAELEYRIRDRDGAWHWFRDRFIDKRRVGDETLIEGLATDITGRKEVEQKLQRYAEEQAALYAIAAEASAYMTPQTMLSSVLDRVILVVGCDAGWVTLPGATVDDPPVVVAARGVSDAFVAAEGSGPLRGCPVCEPMLTNDSPEPDWAVIDDCPRLPPGVLSALSLHSHISVPLRAADQVLGFLHLAWHAPQVETATNERLLTAVGRQIGLALRNAQLYQEARQVDRLRTINEIATGLFSSLDEEAVLRQILDPMCRALDAAEGVVWLRDPAEGDLFLAMALTDRGNQNRGRRWPPGQGIAGWVLQHGEAVVVNDVERDPRYASDVDGASSPTAGSLICAPLKYLESTIGVVEILSKPRKPFDGEDLGLLESVASVAALALENARLYQDLERVIVEHEKTQAKLVHAAKMSALGRLTASVAHEITNPVQAVQGYLSLAEERLDAVDPEEPVQRFLHIASDEVDRISDILKHLREFYRPTRPGFWPTDVEAVLERVLELSRKKLEESHVVVAWDKETGPSSRLPRVEANADQLGQVFLNMVINAIEAMPEGGTLRIRTALEEAPDVDHPMVRIEFADTGVGLDSVARERLFEPFFTTKEEGSGLGLSVSYGIIQSHRGEIWVESETGQGSTFAVRLPVEQPPGAP
ncbi:MAG: PAS domain S-box protein [Anaerolineae bacterium]